MSKEVASVIQSSIRSQMFRERYADVFTGDEQWAALDSGGGQRFGWVEDSTYVPPCAVLPGPRP